jgi:SAM-dependent methyltransferase
LNRDLRSDCTDEIGRNEAANAYARERVEHWDGVARSPETWSSWGRYYHRRLNQIYQFLVAPGQRVLEIGCGLGDLLASLKPSIGIGVDFSNHMIQRAKKKHPELQFIQCDAHNLSLNEKPFDIIILSDIANDLWDVQAVFEQVRTLARSRTRVLLNFYSHLWEKPLTLAQRLGCATPNLPQNWLTTEDMCNLLYLADFEVIRHWQEILWPLSTPFLSLLSNRYLVKIWPFRILAMANFIIARPRPARTETGEESLVSVIVPARNEAGNISRLFARMPNMGRRTELIFVEGHSEDDTYATIEKAVTEHPELLCKLYRQTGNGKGDAVRLGFSRSSGEILMILDADMTVPPEDLPRFYEAIRSGKAEFVNGVRLVYPLEKIAMRFFNLLGNKFFSLAFSWLLGQSIKDTLCGTKVFTRETYLKIANNRDYFGDFDPFGDFDLLFGAAKLNLKILDLPIRYRERTYGSTNIERWKHGWLLFKMIVFAARRIKFV